MYDDVFALLLLYSMISGKSISDDAMSKSKNGAPCLVEEIEAPFSDFAIDSSEHRIAVVHKFSLQ